MYVIEMSADTLQLVADHTGHSLAMHTYVYRLHNSVLERTMCPCKHKTA